MIDSIAAGNIYSSNNLPGKTDRINAFNYQESGTIETKESFHFQTDEVSLSYSLESVTTYNNSLNLEARVGDGFDLLRGLVLNIFEEQGIEYKVNTGESQLDLRDITQADAEELVADEGYFGVEKTSERIFNFAVGIAGGDPTRLDAIKEGVEKGFQEALDAFGGWLPDISYETYDSVMSKLDVWAGNDSNTKTIA